MEVVVPLSEEELRLLEQMEQALAQEDPKFVSTLRGSSLERAARLRTIAAAVVFVIGVAMLMGGAMGGSTNGSLYWVAIAGFVVMVGSATVGLAAWRGRHAPSAPAQQPRGDQLFDFDDNPRRFDVIEGGRRQRKARAPKAPKLPRRARGPMGRSQGRSQGRAQGRAQGTFMQRMEQRWERRRHEGGL